MAFLIGMSDAIKGQKFEIKRDRTTIGRNPNNVIVLNDSAISSQHCYISHRGGRYILHDLNSTNGTMVNSQPVTEVELKPKQVLQIGSLELMFDDDRPEAPVGLTTSIPKVTIDNAPATKPLSFLSVSPFGRQRSERKWLWLAIIAIIGLLAFVGIMLVLCKLLG